MRGEFPLLISVRMLSAKVLKMSAFKECALKEESV